MIEFPNDKKFRRRLLKTLSQRRARLRRRGGKAVKRPAGPAIYGWLRKDR